MQETRERIASLDAMSDEIQRYLGALKPLRLRCIDITIPPPKDGLPEEVRNAQLICDIFWREAERLRPSAERHKHLFSH